MDLAIEPYGILSVTTSTSNLLFTKETLPEAELVCTYRVFQKELYNFESL
jgi:hypothetical protein